LPIPRWESLCGRDFTDCTPGWAQRFLVGTALRSTRGTRYMRKGTLPPVSDQEHTRGIALRHSALHPVGELTHRRGDGLVAALGGVLIPHRGTDGRMTKAGHEFGEGGPGLRGEYRTGVA
jgi:hypothetical protein